MEFLPKIQKTSVADQVFDLLKNYISEGKIKVGEKLPSENELCAMLGVSRPPVNAAVNRLRAMGLVEVRPGDGSYVKQFSSEEYIQTYADLVINPEDISEILEIRRALDVESFRLAMERATEEDLDAMAEISKRIVKAHIEKNYEDLIESDYGFHLAICKASKNKYFPLLYEVISGALRKQIMMFSVSRNKRLDADAHFIDDHMKILQALRDKDFDLYIKILDDHTNYESHKD